MSVAVEKTTDNQTVKLDAPIELFATGIVDVLRSHNEGSTTFLQMGNGF